MEFNTFNIWYVNVNPTDTSGVYMFNDARKAPLSANVMINLGCVDPINLDGGDSSALYANGQTLKSAGRALNTVLTINSR